MNGTGKLLSIFILTWNSSQYIKRCFESLLKAAEEIQHEFIVIDNGSKDNTIALIKDYVPYARIISNKKNIGVAPARNVGFKHGRGHYFLFIDVDTKIHQKEILADFMNQLETDKSIGIIAPKLLWSDGTVQDSCKRYPGLLATILRQVPDSRFATRFQNILSYHEMRDFDHNTRREVEYVIGAFQLMRAEVLHQVKGYYNMFCGPDDIDICIRMRLLRYKIMYDPKYQVTHFNQKASKKKLLSPIARKHYFAMLYYLIKHHGNIRNLRREKRL